MAAWPPKGPPTKTASCAITLHHQNLANGETTFVVVAIENSIAVLPGSVLTSEQVQALCDDAGWNVAVLTPA